MPKFNTVALAVSELSESYVGRQLQAGAVVLEVLEVTGTDNGMAAKAKVIRGGLLRPGVRIEIVE